MSDPNHGVVREAQVRELAARLGVADFVYSAPQVAKGSSQREASGDGLLLIGSNGAVLQVKTRDPQKAEGDSDKRAEEWVQKNARKARDQGLGAKRELVRRYRAGVPITVYPVRAAGLSPDVRSLYARRVVHDASSWPVIVVVDHPKCRALDLGFESGVAWFTFKDWHELQRRLRSTAALLHYLNASLKARIMCGSAAKFNAMDRCIARTKKPSLELTRRGRTWLTLTILTSLVRTSFTT